MAKQSEKFDEDNLTKGEARKLNALRKSVGDDIGDKAFAEWLQKREKKVGNGQTVDRNAQRIADALQPLIEANQLNIPRGGYLLKRGRRRVVVMPPEAAPAPAPAPVVRAPVRSAGRRRRANG